VRDIMIEGESERKHNKLVLQNWCFGGIMCLVGKRYNREQGDLNFPSHIILKSYQL